MDLEQRDLVKHNFINDIAVNLDERKQTDVILLDFSEALTELLICASVISYLIWV